MSSTPLLRRRLGDQATKSAAYAAVPQVCRTASTLYDFVNYAKLINQVRRTASITVELCPSQGLLTHASLSTKTCTGRCCSDCKCGMHTVHQAVHLKCGIREGKHKQQQGTPVTCSGGGQVRGAQGGQCLLGPGHAPRGRRLVRHQAPHAAGVPGTVLPPLSGSNCYHDMGDCSPTKAVLVSCAANAHLR